MAILPVNPGDARHAELSSIWRSEGQPGQFEERGDFGYRRWRPRTRDDGQLQFLLLAAAGPTSTGYDEDTGEYKSAEWHATSGSEIELLQYGLRIREGPDGEGDMRLSVKSAPRDESVLED